MERRPELFRSWTDADMADLASRFAVGGQLTEAGIEKAIAHIEGRREIVGQVAVILETPRGRLLEDVVGVLYESTTKVA